MSSLDPNTVPPSITSTPASNTFTLPPVDASYPDHSTPLHISPSFMGSHFGVTPNGIRLTVCTLAGTTWPSDLILDLGKANWLEWSNNLSLLALQQGFEPWLDGSLSCPDASLSSDTHFIWKQNDAALRACIRGHVSPADRHLIQFLPTTHLMFKGLKSHHEQ
jgi:hypothetical protein